MADVTGPIASLPGFRHRLPAGTMCDDHPDRPAVIRVQGETDSFGCEMIDWCQECYDEYVKHRAEAAEEMTYCDWCKTSKTACNPHRDFEEGSTGPIYNVCPACRAAESKRIQEEY